jgi:hypothetical protein
VISNDELWGEPARRELELGRKHDKQYKELSILVNKQLIEGRDPWHMKIFLVLFNLLKKTLNGHNHLNQEQQRHAIYCQTCRVLAH